ncbi:MAG: bifunctional hydroxymethylpyrimidine kinase/phosphomethylpyrimidine kinase [Selenomonadaceae bacterium]|nr:bifunctional hydroxymethylpyrimidine kinase/phosphomethylpyrimidine kinase [Selenomonadaceae bacterium]
MYKVLSIAGSDSSGGAGVQADLKTMTAHGVYGMSAITALTAQNTTGVRSISEVAPEFLREEIRAVFDDIFPDAVKIGMVSSSALIEVIAEELERYKARHIVVDPVMVSTSGSVLMKDEAKKALTEKLFPLAEVITPNLSELGVLVGEEIKDIAGMEKAAVTLAKRYKVAVLAKGGHLTDDAVDILATKEGETAKYAAKRADNPNTHGTGCTLSSAIASNLAKGETLKDAVKNAKQYVLGAIEANLDLGNGRGPLNHMYRGIV